MTPTTMRATSLRDAGRVELVDAPWPTIAGPRDAVVRVTRSAICGTDLHPYRGEIPGFRPDTIMGHEFVGVVEDVGPEAELAGVAVGTLVVASDVIACGSCWWCTHGAHYQCAQVSLFGYGEVVGSYVPGGQADAVRVPFADTVLTAVPDGVTDDSALFVGDVLTTGWTAAAETGIDPDAGDVVAVVGCGPVGLCAILSARLQGAGTIVAVDAQAARLTAALATAPASAGSDGTEIVGTSPDGARKVVEELTGGRGADRVIEAVGSSAALAGALRLVRPRGVVAAVGAHHDPTFPLDTGDAFGRELTLRFAVGDPIRWGKTLFAHLDAGRIDPARIVTHRLPLDEVADAYALFDRGEATKVLLLPDP
jgi:threonine dehydrogenase-like Zn-dependent dehydrogenase